MDKTEIYIKIDNNIRDLSSVENNISTLQFAIYQNSIDKIKEQKNKEIKEYLEGNLEFYNQRSEVYKDKINAIYEEYDYQMKRITNVYDKMFVDVLKILKNACNNQKIAIGNIVTVDNQYNQDFLTPEKITDLRNLKMACAQKKVNYSVIIKECKARLNWIMENVQKDLLEIFDNTKYIGNIGLPDDRAKMESKKEAKVKENKDDSQVTVTDKKDILDEKNDKPAGIFKRLAKFFRNLFHGTQKYNTVINNFNSDLFLTKGKVDSKINELAYTLAGITKQLENAKKRINAIYEQASKNNSLI